MLGPETVEVGLCRSPICQARGRTTDQQTYRPGGDGSPQTPLVRRAASPQNEWGSIDQTRCARQKSSQGVPARADDRVKSPDEDFEWSRGIHPDREDIATGPQVDRHAWKDLGSRQAQ